MLLTKKLMFMLCLICACFMTVLLNAQDESMFMFYDETENDGRDGGINTGYVVANGEFISGPYYVTFTDDTVRINGIPFKPFRPDPNFHPREYSPEVKQMSEVREEIKQNYNKYNKVHGKQEAMGMIVVEFENDDRISSLTFSEDGEELWVEFLNGVQYDILDRGDPSIPRFPSVSEEERIASLAHQVEEVQKMLQNNRMLIFGYGFGITIFAKKGTMKIIDTVNDVKNRNISLDEGEQRIAELLHSPKMAEKIRDNIGTW